MPHSTAPVSAHDRMANQVKVFTNNRGSKFQCSAEPATFLDSVKAAEKADPPCRLCARRLTYVATMRGIGLRPEVTVYRCDHCKRIETEETIMRAQKPAV